MESVFLGSLPASIHDFVGVSTEKFNSWNVRCQIVAPLSAVAGCLMRPRRACYSLSSQALVNHHFYFNTQSKSSGEGLNLTHVTQWVDISISPISVTIPSTHILTNICKSPMSVTMANYQRGLDISRLASYYVMRNVNKEYICTRHMHTARTPRPPHPLFRTKSWKNHFLGPSPKLEKSFST